ncbi:MAG TPA: DUF1697 domain-containing protein [Allosphingosinicella sp.]|nr:DUF1697 domain-containing protein [Allosphingosinicella sp.]
MARLVALLRGINVGGRNLVPMAELKAMAAALGWDEPQTYIQSGNLVFKAAGSAAALERALEAALEQKPGIRTDVLVRTKAQWNAIVAANPFRADAEKDPNLVLCGIPKKGLAGGAAEALAARAAAGERVREAGGVLWFHYPEGAGRSKLTPALIDRSAGSPVTARNWRTMLKLGEMLAP